jgi:hypothetical protein
MMKKFRDLNFYGIEIYTVDNKLVSYIMQLFL